eukprot:scaffold193450_cov22-Tisochrysis_lutea.AAC.2
MGQHDYYEVRVHLPQWRQAMLKGKRGVEAREKDRQGCRQGEKRGGGKQCSREKEGFEQGRMQVNMVPTASFGSSSFDCWPWSFKPPLKLPKAHEHACPSSACIRKQGKRASTQ